MPHKCVRCGKTYASQSAELMKGCSCGSRVFLFMKDAAAEEQAEQKDYSWLEDDLDFLARQKPVSIDVDAVENLRVLEKGHYELNLSSLMSGDPLVIKTDQDIYYIKLPSFRRKTS